MPSSDGDDEDWREDPEPDLPSLGPETPSVDVPEVDVNETVTPGEDGDRETCRLFWRLVVVFDVALLAMSLGPMFIYFRGNWRRGLTLFVFGALVFAYGVVKYRRFRNSDREGDAGSEGGEGHEDGGGGENGTDGVDSEGGEDSLDSEDGGSGDDAWTAESTDRNG